MACRRCNRVQKGVAHGDPKPQSRQVSEKKEGPFGTNAVRFGSIWDIRAGRGNSYFTKEKDVSTFLATLHDASGADSHDLESAMPRRTMPESNRYCPKHCQSTPERHGVKAEPI